LYNGPEIPVYDGAALSLDSETEIKIMDEIYDAGKNKTLIIVGRRLSTVEKYGCGIYRENETGYVGGIMEQLL
jgi:ABC-type transport system involved in Fe-S cluster assembly fused permease/ATPase subunit